MIKDYVCIDLETTGLNPKMDKIIEVGAIKVQNGEVVETLSYFINPGRKLSPIITQITGIHDIDLVDAKTIEETIEEIISFSEGFPLLGHNLIFDYSFLKKASVNQKLVFERMGIDTLKIARKVLPQLESRSLEALCKYYGIEHEAHRALGDVKATIKLFEKMCATFPDLKVVPTNLVYQAKKEGPITGLQKEWLKALIIKHHLSPEYEVERLTKNEASRELDRILSEYGR